ncbi:DUF6059 family protein [Streptomyces sp. NPDC025273]|uniref:DUF6059 family protein n=1 Tax=unclassified Streptomyces TaxID=2593676 RepID=UPI0033DCF834
MRHVRRALHEIRMSLSAAGWIWLGLSVTGPPPPTAAPPLTGPPEGHPERLRPDVPLTPGERALQRQLTARSGARGD